MTELSEKILEQAQNKNLPLMKVSRRNFLKGALAVGGALALAGCGEAVTEIKTVTVTEPKTVTETKTVTKTVTVTEPKTVTVTETKTVTVPEAAEAKDMVTSPAFILPQYQDCVGCNICMAYCALSHYGELDMEKSNIQVYSYDIKGGMVDIPVLCMKCSDAPCMASCPPKVAAISRDEVTGALILDADKCTGCGNCVEACETTVWDPTGLGMGNRKGRTGCLRLNDEDGMVYGMCDLCKGNPECVLGCPENCLRLSTHNGATPGQYWALNADELAHNVWNLLYGCK